MCVRYQPGRVGLTGEAGALCSLPARRAGPHCHVFRPDAGTGEKSVSRTRTQAASHRLAIGSESVPKIIINDTIWVISTHNSFRVLFDKIASVYFI